MDKMTDFSDIAMDWDLLTIELFVTAVLYAHAESFDGCPPEDLPELESNMAYRGSLSTACRVIANSVAGTTQCPHGIGIGDLTADFWDDSLAATKAVTGERFKLSKSLCRRSAKKFVKVYCVS